MNGPTGYGQPSTAYAQNPGQPAPLPLGWTEHKAKTGHIYYYNKALNKSTYTRPAPEPSPTPAPEPQPQIEEQQFIPSYSAGQFAGGFAAQQFQAPPGQQYQNHARQQNRPPHRKQDNDRPKHKYTIPGCAPWVLVKTKFGRRFVHNTETKESLWKIPQDVMKGVIEFDRLQREKQERRDRGDPSDDEAKAGDEEAELAASKEVTFTPAKQEEESDSEYELVTDSDDEGEGGEEGASKRQRTTEPEEEDGPVEFTEEDMAWQLQAMEEDGYGEEYAEGEGEYYEEEPPLSEEDAKNLFKDLLDDYSMSPFTPWDRIIDEGRIVEDDRYVALPNMKARRDCFDEWSRVKMAEIKAKRERLAKQDPKIPYFQLLDEQASTKLYWPEFKRKFRKEAAMKDTKVSDKDKEKFYREHVKRLAMPKETLKKDFTALLKSLPLAVLNRGTSVQALPSQLITDLRYISLPVKSREPMLEAYRATLDPAPDAGDGGEDAAAEAERKRDRERREKALRDRQDKVEEAKRQHQRDQRFARERLGEKERELERAMRVGKEGLKGHFEDVEMKDGEEK